MVDDREYPELQDEKDDAFDIRGAGESTDQTPSLYQARRRRLPATVLLAIFGLLVVAATACGGSTGDSTDAAGDVINISPTVPASPPPVPTESPVAPVPTVTPTEVASPTVVPSVTPTRVPTRPSTVLTFVEVEIDDEGGVDGLDSVRLVTISPDGKHLYAASRDDDAVAVFSRDSTTGELTFVEAHKDNVGAVDALDTVISLAISPDGNHLYAPSPKDNALAVFNRNSETGELEFMELVKNGVDGVEGLRGAFSLAVSPDGNYIYVASSDDQSVVVFSRDSTTGALVFVEAQYNDEGSIFGLAGAWLVTVSPDGNHVYAAGFNDNAVVAFSRDSATGGLTFLGAVQDGQEGVDGLAFPNSLTISSDGNSLYAAGRDDDAVAVFSRDSETGFLTFVEVQRDGVDGVDGLNGSRSVTISPDGKLVYVTGSDDDAVAVFTRNSTTSRLTYLGAHLDGVGDVDGLNGAVSIAASPDGKHIYVASFNANALATFSVEQ